jgi:hypothetical protein
MKIPVAAFLISLFSCICAHAADADWGAESLRGLKPFKFSMAMGACPFELSTKVYTDLNRDVELKLRIARIPFDDKANLPRLILALSCLRINVGGRQVGYAINMRLSVAQYLLSEDTKQHLTAETWETENGTICSDSCPDETRGMAKNMVDEFANAYLKANENK